LNDYKEIVEAIFTKHKIPTVAAAAAAAADCLYCHPLTTLVNHTTTQPPIHSHANVSLMRRQHFVFS